MKFPSTIFTVLLATLVGILSGCSSTPRIPSVAIMFNNRDGYRPSPDEVAEVQKMVQPEIERRGYTLARRTSSADYLVYVNFPLKPTDLWTLRFEKAPPNVPFLPDTNRTDSREQLRKVNDEMTREPK